MNILSRLVKRERDRKGEECFIVDGTGHFTPGVHAQANAGHYTPPEFFDFSGSVDALTSHGEGSWYETPGNGTLRPPVPWGRDNNAPGEMVKMVESTPLLAAAMEFKSALLFGDGVVPIRRIVDSQGKSRVEPYYGWQEVNDFLRESDVNTWFAEQCLDVTVLGNVFSEIVLSRDRQRVRLIRHREAIFTRHELANPETGEIEHTFLSGKWNRCGLSAPDDLQIIPLLPRHETLRALLAYSGRAADVDGRFKPRQDTSYTLPTRVPTLGAPYYTEPWWLALYRSGWLDFAASIPRYKRAALNNSTSIRYVVKINPLFWEGLFRMEGATTENEREAARQRWFRRLNDFLSNPENTGRAFITGMTQSGDHFEDHITIEPLKNESSPGGELITDLEEVSNILAYGMGVHPSLIGASPGRSKSINGTEARELFIIKQSLLNPIRQRLLEPLRLIARFNGWPPEVDFTVRNLELTTLDQHTGARRGIGQEGVEP